MKKTIRGAERKEWGISSGKNRLTDDVYREREIRQIEGNNVIKSFTCGCVINILVNMESNKSDLNTYKIK